MAGVYKSIFTGPEIDAKLSERVPSTPSGSPLHYLFVAAGAVWDTSSSRGVGRRAALPYPASKTPRREIRDVARCHGRGAR